MKKKLSIVLLILGTIVAFHPTHSADHSIEQQGMIKVTIMYPGGEGKTFDMDYYKTKHMPMLAKLFGDAMMKYEIDEGLSGRTPEDELPFLAIGYLYFNSIAAYGAVFKPNAETILNDIPNYTNSRPVVQFSKVVK